MLTDIGKLSQRIPDFLLFLYPDLSYFKIRDGIKNLLTLKEDIRSYKSFEYAGGTNFKEGRISYFHSSVGC